MDLRKRLGSGLRRELLPKLEATTPFLIIEDAAYLTDFIEEIDGSPGHSQDKSFCVTNVFPALLQLFPVSVRSLHYPNYVFFQSFTRSRVSQSGYSLNYFHSIMARHPIDKHGDYTRLYIIGDTKPLVITESFFYLDNDYQRMEAVYFVRHYLEGSRSWIEYYRQRIA